LVIGVLLAACWRVYVGQFPLRVDRWGCIVGFLGGGLWIGVCTLGIERSLVELLGLPETILGIRSSVDPFHAYPNETTRWLFWFFRFALLVVIVPLAEELFLRGFLMRVVDTEQWMEQPLDQIGTVGLVSGTLYGVLSHPSEFVAAALWFSLITMLMTRSGKFWNCVLAHAITNLILGVYICLTGSWSLW
jgi:CAAX prenyl protease-like protein